MPKLKGIVEVLVQKGIADKKYPHSLSASHICPSDLYRYPPPLCSAPALPGG